MCKHSYWYESTFRLFCWCIHMYVCTFRCISLFLFSLLYLLYAFICLLLVLFSFPFFFWTLLLLLLRAVCAYNVMLLPDSWSRYNNNLLFCCFLYFYIALFCCSQTLVAGITTIHLLLFIFLNHSSHNT